MNAAWQRPSELTIQDACTALGVSRATLYRHPPSASEPKVLPASTAVPSAPLDPAAPAASTPSEARTKRPRRAGGPQPRALSEVERAAVLAVLHEERFADLPPPQVYAQLLGEGRYLCSIRTMYRVLEAVGEVRERRDQRQHPRYAAPQLCATGPNRVWSWDITKLAGPRPRCFYSLYVVLDIFSRYVVGWLLADRECEILAQDLLAESCRKHSVEPGRLVVHADRGAAMTAKSVADLLNDFGVTTSHSRPRVSNDNAYSESQFKTVKYRPDFPDRFASLDAAREHCRHLIAWYNTEHFHSSLGLLTPEQVHYGQTADILANRQRVLDLAYQAHPERFVNARPRPAEPETAVYINRPLTTAANAIPITTGLST